MKPTPVAGLIGVSFNIDGYPLMWLECCRNDAAGARQERKAGKESCQGETRDVADNVMNHLLKKENNIHACP